MKKNFLLMLLISLGISCNSKKSERAESTSNPQSSVDQQSSGYFENETVIHLLENNSGSVLYMKSGERMISPMSKLKGDALYDIINSAKTDGTYTTGFTFILEQQAKEKDTIPFFQEDGKITPNWDIINGMEIINPMQIVAYHEPNPNQIDSIQNVDATTLLLFYPKPPEFEDENSQEALDYEAMDDVGYYFSELISKFQELNIKSISAESDFIAFPIDNGKILQIDFEKAINQFESIYAVLHKKGKYPIVVNLFIDDNDWNSIEDYLKD